MEVFFPETLEAFWPLLEQFPEGRIVAGGTDVMVELRKTGQQPPALFFLERIKKVQHIELRDEGLCIGAGVTLQRLLESPVVERQFRALWQAVAVLGSPPVRHSATLGGNLCTASPAGDTLPPLYIMDATIRLASSKGCRDVALRDFILGPGQTALQPGEILMEVTIPRAPKKWVSAYYKVGKRKAMAIAIVSLAAALSREGDGRVQDIALAWGSVGPTVLRLPEVESFLRGKYLDAETLQEAGRLVMSSLAPIDDIRASVAYRRQVAVNLLVQLRTLAE